MAAEAAGILCAGAVLLAGLAVDHERHRSSLAANGPIEPVEVPHRGFRGPTARGRRGGSGIQGLLVSGRWRASRRADALEGQLADAIAAIAAGSRAGMSLPQAVTLASEQVPEPLGGSLRELVDRTRLGDPLEAALDRWAGQVSVPDARLVAAVLRLTRRIGGAAAPVLEGLARTLRERRTAVREMRSLTAQARLSGAILGLLPIGFFGFLWLTSRRDMLVAIGSPLGRAAVAGGLVLETAAFLWIRRLLRVES